MQFTPRFFEGGSLRTIATEGVDRMRANEQPSLPGGTRLRRARDARSLSQREVAVAVGCSPGAVWRWESGRNLPQSRFRAALADVLQIDRSELGQWFGIDEGDNVIYIHDPLASDPAVPDRPAGSAKGPVTEAERQFFDALLAGVRDGHAARRRWNRVVENTATWLGIPWERADPHDSSGR